VKAWEKLYDKEDLKNAAELAERLSIKSNDGVQITAQVEGYEVETFIQYAGPSYSSCTCPSQYPCRHEAALTYYLINHPEACRKSPGVDEILNMANHDDLKDFLMNEFGTNPDLRERFIERFSGNPIDRDYYTSKLNEVLRNGEGRDFQYHGFHDLDMMRDDLYDFILTDISNVLSAKDHDFACGLLIRIAKLLNDEVISTFDSWDGLADRFMEQVDALSFSLYLDAEKLDELYANIDHIMSLI